MSKKEKIVEETTKEVVQEKSVDATADDTNHLANVHSGKTKPIQEAVKKQELDTNALANIHAKTTGEKVATTESTEEGNG